MKFIIEISEPQDKYLESKSLECGCTIEEFIDLLITRDMVTDCRYYYCGYCTISGDQCHRTSEIWLNGHQCDVAIDHEGDLETLNKMRG